MMAPEASWEKLRQGLKEKKGRDGRDLHGWSRG